MSERIASSHGAFKAMDKYFAEKQIKGGFLEGIAHLKTLEESGEGYYGEWASLSKELRAEYYECVSGFRAMFAPVEG